MRRGYLLTAWVVAACSSAPTPRTAPGPTSAPAAGSVPPKPGTAPAGMVVARLGTGDLRFLLARHDSLTLQYPTGSQMQVLNREAWVRLLLTSADGITIVLDSLRTSAGVPLDSLRALDGLVWTGTLERGRVVTLTPSRAAALAEQLALPLVTDLLPALPADGVKGGSAWRDSTVGAQRVAGAQLPMTTVTEYQVREATGLRELEVRGTSQLSAKGTSAQFGQTIDIVASGTRQHLWRLTSTGQLAGTQGSDSLALSLDVPSVGQTVPATQLGRFSATRMPATR